MSTDVVTVPLRDLPAILRECLRSGLLVHGFEVIAHGPALVADRELEAFLCTVANNVAQVLVGMSAAEE